MKRSSQYGSCSPPFRKLDTVVAQGNYFLSYNAVVRKTHPLTSHTFIAFVSELEIEQ